MLFKLSIKNISKSMKDYAIYFFTLILGVSIFYVFNAIESQTIMMNVSSATYEIIKLMTNMLSGVSVFVSFVLAFLIIYASRFLIKRRNKEFIADDENSYLEEQEDGSYVFYYGEYKEELSKEDVESGVYDSYPIIEYDKK